MSGPFTLSGNGTATFAEIAGGGAALRFDGGYGGTLVAYGDGTFNGPMTFRIASDETRNGLGVLTPTAEGFTVSVHRAASGPDAGATFLGAGTRLGDWHAGDGGGDRAGHRRADRGGTRGRRSGLTTTTRLMQAGPSVRPYRRAGSTHCGGGLPTAILYPRRAWTRSYGDLSTNDHCRDAACAAAIKLEPARGRQSVQLHRHGEELPRMPRLILVVENDAPLLQALADAVTELGYDATLATTAADGVTLAELARPDAILLDIAVPEITGTSALDRLKTVHPDVPIIMVASATAESFARDTLKRGAFDYVMKPFNISHLTEVLRAAVRRSG